MNSLPELHKTVSIIFKKMVEKGKLITGPLYVKKEGLTTMHPYRNSRLPDFSGGKLAVWYTLEEARNIARSMGLQLNLE